MLKRLTDALGGARRLEWWAMLAVAAAALLMLGAGTAHHDAAESTALEARLQRLIEHIDGAGKAQVVITESGGEPQGAVIVCEDLKDVRAYLEIQSAVQALLNIDLSRIHIIGGNRAFGGDGT